ncbi:hypothetical protein Zmor_002524 [Zophobas morio]|uniref:Uncharacterized protein n=1 Tax=Zophobas morio TaxID=2755281 RepID=A0AA38MU84_9CUCU|nr:hypothetical protein Zmor_002524 [Zophobas morio]
MAPRKPPLTLGSNSNRSSLSRPDECLRSHLFVLIRLAAIKSCNLSIFRDRADTAIKNRDTPDSLMWDPCRVTQERIRKQHALIKGLQWPASASRNVNGISRN